VAVKVKRDVIVADNQADARAHKVFIQHRVGNDGIAAGHMRSFSAWYVDRQAYDADREQ
jgi:hypothetical protein